MKAYCFIPGENLPTVSLPLFSLFILNYVDMVAMVCHGNFYSCKLNSEKDCLHCVEVYLVIFSQAPGAPLGALAGWCGEVASG